MGNKGQMTQNYKVQVQARSDIRLDETRQQHLRRIALQIRDSKVRHAKWAAKRIAYWMKTRLLKGKQGDTVASLLQLVAHDPFTQIQLKLYLVHPALIPYAARLAATRVQETFGGVQR